MSTEALDMSVRAEQLGTDALCALVRRLRKRIEELHAERNEAVRVS